MITANKKIKLALLINMIAPYRLPLLSLLADEFDLLVLHGGKEANRDAWSNLEDALPNARVVRAWGWQIRYTKKVNGVIFDEKFMHIMPGVLWHLLRFRPDAIVSNEMGFRSVMALAYATIFRRPVWIWWGGTLHSERSIGRLRKAMRKVITLWAGHWVTYGQTSTEYLLSLGVKRDRILQSQNGIDEARFQASGEPAWTIEPRPVVLHVGQFIERKGIGSLLEAAAALQKQGCAFSILLVGSGHDKLTIRQRGSESQDAATMLASFDIGAAIERSQCSTAVIVDCLFTEARLLTVMRKQIGLRVFDPRLLGNQRLHELRMDR